MSQLFDIIVIGGGAAGMTAAIAAARHGRKTLVIEKSEKAGRKILASGNGRCNMLNSLAPRYFGDPVFAKKVLEQCGTRKIIVFFRELGLPVAEDNDGRIYPVTFQSSSVLTIMNYAMQTSGTAIMKSTAAAEARKTNDGFEVITDQGTNYHSRKIVIACGGEAQPRLGGTKDGYRLLKTFGHRIIPTRAALVPLATDRTSISGLSGIRVKCRVTLRREGKTVHEEKGEVLFTDYGVSGICVMQCARFASGGSELVLDLMSGLYRERMDAVREIKRRQIIFADLPPASLLEGILPGKLSYAVMKQAGIPLKGEKAGNLDEKDLDRIAAAAYEYRITVLGNRGMDYAQVTAGGADCREFNPATMESRIVPGLFAAGEVLNVDGDCGGFNLMFAFASGIIAGQSV